jgi:predicted acetyltransferase
MSLKLSWRGRESADIIALTRARSYAPGMGETAVYQQRLAKDPRVTGDELLLAERDGAAVGTATSYSMKMWVRGRAVKSQGVAWVGTVKTQRRLGGVASQIMAEVIRKGRERGQTLSALMPFRASFYEHFGYGVVERRANWTIPLSVMPSGSTEGFEFLEGADEARRACRQRMVEAGQCDIERTPGMWTHWTTQEGEGYAVSDRGAADGSMRSWFVWREQRENDQNVLVVDDLAFDSLEALRRGLCFFGTLRDQFRAVRLTLPADLQVNRLLKETQVPAGAKGYDAANVKLMTRMQVRVLDHARLIDGMRVPEHVRGSAVVAIAETEGGASRLRIEMDGGRASITNTTATADVECADRDWAAIALGDLPGTRAAELGLIKVNRAAALGLLDAFAAAGPAPFCNEHF